MVYQAIVARSPAIAQRCQAPARKEVQRSLCAACRLWCFMEADSTVCRSVRGAPPARPLPMSRIR